MLSARNVLFFLNRYFLRNTTMEVQAKGGGKVLVVLWLFREGPQWPYWLLLSDKQVRLQQALPLYVWVETFLWVRQIFPSLESFSGPRLAPPGVDFHFSLGNRFKIHTVCGKGMSAGWVREKMLHGGEGRENGPKVAVSKESLSIEKWMTRHDTKGSENQNKYR